MASKAKSKPKPSKKPAKRQAAGTKSLRLKAKAVKKSDKATAKPVVKSPARTSKGKTSKTAKMESRRNSVANAASSRSTSPLRTRSKQFVSAVHAYEAGIKLIHAEEFQKAIRCFENLIADHPEETEIQERAKVLLHACEKKIQEKARTVLRSADDHYNVGIADLNRGALDSAIHHLQQALKLTPKGDHVLYALAAANALQGKRDPALQHLKQAIHHRPENRFLASRDGDFESLYDDPDFKQLVTTTEK